MRGPALTLYAWSEQRPSVLCSATGTSGLYRLFIRSSGLMASEGFPCDAAPSPLHASFLTSRTISGDYLRTEWHGEERYLRQILVKLTTEAATLTALALPPVTAPGLVDFAPLLSQQMPLLQALSITVCHPNDCTTVCLSVPVLAFPASRFPRLTQLRLDGVAPSLGAPFLPSLRKLVLSNCPVVERCLPLARLMIALQNCPGLQVLELRRFCDIVVMPEEHPGQPAALLQLDHQP
ncbi:hypothetical protein BD413DRAFT_255390 [Trametes elegans]|nr:hypothetical protein BD413DRAFT_255390 [Trametes elegans]